MNKPPKSRLKRIVRRIIDCTRYEHCFHTATYEDEDDYCCHCGKPFKETDWKRRGFSRWRLFHL